MLAKSFSQGQRLLAVGSLIDKGRNIGWWRIRRIIKDDSGHPRAPRNRLRSLRAGSHCHHSRIGDQTAVPTIRNRNATKIQHAHTTATLFSTMFSRSRQILISFLQEARSEVEAVL